MICRKCGIDKEDEQFEPYKNRGKIVIRKQCRDCISQYKKEHYQKNKEKYLDKSKAQKERDPEGYKAYLKKYYQDNREGLLEKQNAYNTSEHGRELNKLRSRRYRATEEGLMKDRVRSMVNTALRDGHITKPDSCTTCGDKGYIEAHHEDYSNPLDVIWLCKQCHENIHHLNEEHTSI